MLALSGCDRSPRQSARYPSEVYFSPDGGIREHILRAIDNTASSIDLAVFNITSREIRRSLEGARERGVTIRIITDAEEAKDAHSLARILQGEGFNVRLAHGRDRGIMHNKFALFDGKLLVTGSYNWTYSAERFNNENVIFVSDPQVIDRYKDEFARLWNFSQGRDK